MVVSESSVKWYTYRKVGRIGFVAKQKLRYCTNCDNHNRVSLWPGVVREDWRVYNSRPSEESSVVEYIR